MSPGLRRQGSLPRPVPTPAHALPQAPAWDLSQTSVAMSAVCLGLWQSLGSTGDTGESCDRENKRLNALGLGPNFSEAFARNKKMKGREKKQVNTLSQALVTPAWQAAAQLPKAPYQRLVPRGVASNTAQPVTVSHKPTPGKQV